MSFSSCHVAVESFFVQCVFLNVALMKLILNAVNPAETLFAATLPENSMRNAHIKVCISFHCVNVNFNCGTRAYTYMYLYLNVIQTF